MVTKAVPFIFRQTKTEKYPLTSLVVLKSLENKRHLKDCYIGENPCETRARFPKLKGESHELRMCGPKLKT